MFDEQQRPKAKLNINEPLIALACGGGGMLLSFGLCGASAAARFRLPFLGKAGIMLFGASIIALFVGFLWLIAAAIINALRN